MVDFTEDGDDDDDGDENGPVDISAWHICDDFAHRLRADDCDCAG